MTDNTKIDPFKLTWDDLRNRARNQTDLSASQQKNAVLAFDSLERLFGNSFLDKTHPLFFFFFDRSAWRSKWAIWFANFLKSLEQHPDFSNLVEGLRRPQDFDERMTILKIVEFLLSVGFLFRLDNPININDRPKKPDIFVQADSSDAGFFIEVTTLQPSTKQREADEAFEKLWGMPFWLHPLELCSGKLERAPAPLHLQEIKEQIQRLAEKARNETGFESLDISGLIRFAVATESHKGLLEKWAAERGMKVGELSGAGVEVDEFERVSSRLKDKIRQIPTDRANVVVVYSHFFAMPPRDTDGFASFVHALEDIVYKYSHVGYLVLIFSWTGGSENTVIRYRDHICVNRRWLYFNCNSIMLIKNRFAAKSMSSAVEAKFLKAFTQNSEKQ